MKTRLGLSKNILATTLLASTAMMTTENSVAQQAQADTEIVLRMPDVVALYYFSEIRIDLNEDVILAHFFNDLGGDTVDKGTITATPAADPLKIQADLSIPVTPLTPPTQAEVVLINAWGVHSVNEPDLDTRLTIAIQEDTLQHTVSLDEITLNPTGPSGTRVDDGNGDGGDSNVDFLPPGLVNPRIGSIVLDFDLTDAIRSGNYAGGVIRLTATNL